MKLYPCPACRRKISSKSNSCVNCGHPIKGELINTSKTCDFCNGKGYYYSGGRERVGPSCLGVTVSGDRYRTDCGRCKGTGKIKRTKLI